MLSGSSLPFFPPQTYISIILSVPVASFLSTGAIASIRSPFSVNPGRHLVVVVDDDGFGFGTVKKVDFGVGARVVEEVDTLAWGAIAVEGADACGSSACAVEGSGTCGFVACAGEGAGACGPGACAGEADAWRVALTFLGCFITL